MFSSPQMIYVSRDPERLQAFYESLGFRPGFRTPAEGPADHADVVLDGFRLGLVRASAAQRDHGLDPDPAPGGAQIVLWTDDVDHAHARLTAHGAPTLSPPHDFQAGLRVCWIADPDGHPVQLVQRRQSTVD
jgi:catechol 2,3-dioxygenase-like lactoylglutathione lyase family enzyme